MTKINGPRYSDSKDFDEIHDKITLWLMDNYKKISQDVISKISQKNALFPKYDFINNENSVIKIDAGIKIESPLNQFNIPDAIVSGDISRKRNKDEGYPWDKKGFCHSGSFHDVPANYRYKYSFPLWSQSNGGR